MSLSMCRFLFVLACSGFTHRGRQVQASPDGLRSSPCSQMQKPVEIADAMFCLQSIAKAHKREQASGTGKPSKALAKVLLALKSACAFTPADPRLPSVAGNFICLRPRRMILDGQSHLDHNIQMSVMVDESIRLSESSEPDSVVLPMKNSFHDLGVSPLLLPWLDAAGIKKPTEIQCAAFTAILEGGNAVLLSETGSGKTLAYALPLLQRIIEMRDKDDSIEGEVPMTAGPNRPFLRDQVLVLVPNKDLATQVEGVFTNLIESLPAEKQKGLRASAVTSIFDGDPLATIVISTPPAALQYWKGPESIRWVVLDEADALLAGTMRHTRQKYPIEQIIMAVKKSARQEAEDASLDTENKVRLRWPKNSNMTRGEIRRLQRANQELSKQFLIVGATMPSAGTKNIQELVKERFPIAKWYRASRLHQSRAEVKQYFVKVDSMRRGEALQQALHYGPSGKVLIFANTRKMAEMAMVDAALALGNDSCAVFHSRVHVTERANVLAAFARGDLRALVCTGMAARGIDFVDVTHVIQYEVAENVVEFMHRIGRTARAGKTGAATTLYTQDKAALIEGIRDALAEGKTVDEFFSRNRLFSLRLKRREAWKREEAHQREQAVFAQTEQKALLQGEQNMLDQEGQEVLDQGGREALVEGDQESVERDQEALIQ